MSSASATDGGLQPVIESPCIIHERQNLQLCAIHTVNNLLQLSENTSQEGWTCGSDGIGNRTTWTYATKAELDTIADELTVAENQLLVAEPSSNGSDYTGSPSILQKLSSQHRTLVFGNYSMEVIQTALEKRGVELSWFTPKHNANMLCLDDPKRIVIGFVVNESREETLFGRILGIFWDSGRHWYAISRIQRGSIHNSKWKVLDGMSDQVEYLSTEEAVFDHLETIVTNGGAVFRATISIENK